MDSDYDWLGADDCYGYCEWEHEDYNDSASDYYGGEIDDYNDLDLYDNCGLEVDEYNDFGLHDLYDLPRVNHVRSTRPVATSAKAESQQKQPQTTPRKGKRKRARKSKSKATESKESDTPKEYSQDSAAASKKNRSSKAKKSTESNTRKETKQGSAVGSKKQQSSKTKASASSTAKMTALNDEVDKRRKEGGETETGARAEETTPDQPSPETKRAKQKRHRKRPKATMLETLSKYESAKVKIPKERSQWTRKIADTLLEYIRKYCKENAPDFFSHLEYTGSFYENLKTGDADEIDIMLALDTKKDADLVIEEIDEFPGYARIKANSRASKYWKKNEKFTTGDGYVRPLKIRSYFFGLVQKAVDKYKKEFVEEQKIQGEKSKQVKAKDDKSGIDVKKLSLKVRDNGPAITLVIKDESMKMELSVDLVPAFLFKEKKADGAQPREAKHYVAKVPVEQLASKHKLPNGCAPKMLWRRSFSLDEKKKMENIDKDNKSCRRAVVKIVKTIRKSDATLAKLTSFHIKTAFLHYNFDEGRADLDWSRANLHERILGLMKYLLECVKAKQLTNFFIPNLNLLEELVDSNLVNIDGRLTNLIENENDLRKIVSVEHSELNPGKSKPVAKKRKITQ